MSKVKQHVVVYFIKQRNNKPCADQVGSRHICSGLSCSGGK